MKKLVQKFASAAPAFVLAASLVGTPVVGAQSARSTGQNHQIALTAVPPRMGDDYTLRVAPGGTVQASIQVRNPTDEPITVETFMRDFIVGSDGQTPIAVDPDVNSRWAISQWTVASPTHSVIEPRQSANITLTITVPKEALPGGRYAMVLHKPVANGGASDSTGAQITAQVGTLLYVIVEGETTEQAAISNFKFDKNLFEMGPTPYSFSVDNNSSFHINPTNGKIVIRNMFGSVSDEISFEGANIFPSGSRDFTGQWNKTWGFGKYTAEITANYGLSNKVMTATTSFWIIPVRLILAMILIIVLVAVVLVSTRTKYSQMLEVEEEKVRKLDEKLKKARRASK